MPRCRHSLQPEGNSLSCGRCRSAVSCSGALHWSQYSCRLMYYMQTHSPSLHYGDWLLYSNGKPVTPIGLDSSAAQRNSIISKIHKIFYDQNVENLFIFFCILAHRSRVLSFARIREKLYEQLWFEEQSDDSRWINNRTTTYKGRL